MFILIPGKKTHIMKISKLTLLLFFSLCAFYLISQSTREGTYNGTLKVSALELPMTIEIQLKNGQWQGDLDIPKQMIKNMKLGALRVTDDSLSFTLPEVPGNAHYSGAFKTVDIEGTFSQAGQNFDLKFIKLVQEIDYSAKFTEIQHLADSLREVFDIPALGIGVYHAGKIVVSEGLGYADLENKRKANNQTLFAIGSTSKAFTATTVGMLVDEEKIEWDKPIQNYIPEFKLSDPFASTEMTATDIMCHRSGLPRHDLLWYGAPFTREELLNKLQYLEPSKPFRTTFQYQNLMFMTAGVLIERLSGKSWEEFTKERIFDPLGMNSSNFSVMEMEKSENAALAYNKTDDKLKVIPYRNIDAVGPAGSINSNIEDMLKWIEFNLNAGKVEDDELIKASTLAYIHTPHMIAPGGFGSANMSHPTYGLGWVIQTYQGDKILHHGGGIDGFITEVLLIPGQELGVVILSNNPTGLPKPLSRMIADIMLEHERNDWVGPLIEQLKKNEEDEDKEEKEEDDEEEVFEPVRELQEYTGKFVHPAYGTVEIFEDQDSLRGRYNNFNLNLTPAAIDAFSAQLKDLNQAIKLKYNSDFEGYITGLSLPLEASVDAIEFEKEISSDLQSVEYLKQFVGNYQEGSNNVEIKLIDNKLWALPTGMSQTELVAVKENVFKPKGLDGFSLEFHWNDQEITHILVNTPNGTLKAVKKE